MVDDWTAAERELADAVRQGRSVVVNVRKSGPHKHLVPWLVEQDLITYIGHAGPRHQWPESVFANPFVREAKQDRKKMVEHYREYLEGREDLLKRVGELRGRALGCWCAPQPCHGDVLLEYLR
jgi:hypothetical protein